jgi:hypothetical protein
VELTIAVGGTTVVAAMDFKEDLHYPLMYVRSVDSR